MKGILIFLPLLFAIAFAQDQPEATMSPQWFFGPPHYPHFPPHFFLPPPHFFSGFPFPFPYNFTVPSPPPSSPSSPSSPSNDNQVNADQKIPFPFHGIPFPFFPHLPPPPHFFLPPHFTPVFPPFPFPFPFPSNSSNSFPFPFPFPFPGQPAQPPSSPSSPSSPSTPSNDEKIPFPFHAVPFPFFHHPLVPPHFFLPPPFTPFFPPFQFPFNNTNPFPLPSQPPSSPSAPSDNDEKTNDGQFPQLPPLPYFGMPPVSDDNTKCFQAVHDRNMVSCLNDFHSFLMTHQISVSSGCCSALQNIQDSCQFNNPLLETIVSQQCAAPAPSN